ncbi:MAG: hypothetical protein AB7E80_16515 [Hyphomicrobiaceae bacterium]
MYARELFRMTFPLAADRLRGRGIRKMLDGLSTKEQLRDYLRQHPQPRFSFYEERTGRKRHEFISLIDHLGIDLAGKRHLDIGPAYGETLDISMQERGAASADFIELDDFFYTWNRLKGYGLGHRGNYLRVVPRLERAAYDTIYVRGLPQVETIWPLRKSWVGFVRIDRWVDTLVGLAAPGGTIMLSPNWRSNGQVRTATPDWASHPFCAMLGERGFVVLPFLEGHNREPENPVTFVLQRA